ncbi:MAG: hypothetical protein LUC45_07115 [Paraprevotella sp.]|nr:hypothetical protein [Paraprevotella sp.]
MKTLNKFQNILYVLGAVMLLVGAASYVTAWSLSFYFYAVGACIFAAMQCLAGYEGDNLIVKRLRIQQVIGALLLVCTAVFMAMRTFNFGFARRNEWMVCLAVACVFELYTAFRIPSELEKESGRNNDNKIKNG